MQIEPFAYFNVAVKLSFGEIFFVPDEIALTSIVFTSESVKWRSETAGDWDGLVVDIEGTPDTRLYFETERQQYCKGTGTLNRSDTHVDW